LEHVATADNISFLFQVTQTIKKSEISAKAKQRELYGICELAQLSINEKCKSHQWALEAYPGTLSLPKSIFTPSQSANVGLFSLFPFPTQLYLKNSFTHECSRRPSSSQKHITRAG